MLYLPFYLDDVILVKIPCQSMIKRVQLRSYVLISKEFGRIVFWYLVYVIFKF